MSEQERKIYRLNASPTLRDFHLDGSQMRCIVGPVGSGKTTAACWEVFYYLPKYLYREYGWKHTKWVIVRNTFKELEDTTLETINFWFGDLGEYNGRRAMFNLTWPDTGLRVQTLFRGCDILKHVRQFKSLEVTGYWVEESIEVKDGIKKMLKGRIGRYPPQSPVRFGIETTNPPSTSHPTYSQFSWNRPPPGPRPKGKPLLNHTGFWQLPGENEAYLRPGYYSDLRNDYADDPDWIDMYILGKPGIIKKGKLVYNNFEMATHVAKENLLYAGGKIYRGWDNTGNHPACVLVQVPSPMQVQILPSYWDARMGIVDFVKYVTAQCAMLYPEAKFKDTDFADPAGEAKFSSKGGGLTSNAQLMRDNGVDTIPSEQNFTARTQAVDQLLIRRNGILIDPDNDILIDGFAGGYHYPEIGTTGHYGEEPVKNKYADLQDALQYVLVKLFKGADEEDDEPLPPINYGDPAQYPGYYEQ